VPTEEGHPLEPSARKRDGNKDNFVNTKPLRYESPEKIYGLLSESKAYSATLGEWRITEVFQPHAHDEIEAGLGSYRLALEKDVTDYDNLFTSLSEACEIAKQIDVAWCYVFEKPFKAAHTRYQLIEAPEGWSGNTREVEAAIRGWAGAVHAGPHRQWEWIPFLPLERVLRVRAAYLKTQPEVQTLIDLHSKCA
jgi:hypothetical protein